MSVPAMLAIVCFVSWFQNTWGQALSLTSVETIGDVFLTSTVTFFITRRI